MIEIIAGMWVACFCLSMITVGITAYSVRKKLQSKTLKTLNKNLAKVDLFWSNSAADFAPLLPDAVETDANKTLRNTFLIGVLSIASLPGFILVLLVVFSIQVLARSRKEMATFRSRLANEENLDLEVIKKLVGEFQQIS